MKEGAVVEKVSMEQKVLPNDKKCLLDATNYEMYNLDLMRKVFPRIIKEYETVHGKKQRKPQIRDIITMYFYLLSYVNGNYLRDNGKINSRFGMSFPSVEKITTDLKIDHRRVKPLVDILETNGLIIETKVVLEGMRRSKLYRVSFCPSISEDGYLVDENGQKIIPDFTKYK